MSENVTKNKEQDGRKPGEDYRAADGILVCGKCGEPRERMFPAGGIFKEPHLVPTMCRCQREEADRQREEAERAEKRRRTERLRKQCFPSSGRYAFCTFDADDGRNAAQSTVCKAFAATFDPKDPEGLVLWEARHGQELPCVLHRERRHRARVLLSRDRYQAGREPDGILLREAFREP